MPKELKVNPNQRVDLPDFNRAANDLTTERAAFDAERVLLDRRSRVVEGFRIRVEDQSANPGQITVINGTALDREGNPLHDEDQQNASVTLTLTGANSTFYLEVELVKVETDTDSRSFWDSSFDNSDPIPDGSEASLSVATRLTPTWRVVQPVSTTGFQSTTNPNSTRVPLAILSTNASNEIDGTSTPGLVQVSAASVTETSISAGGTSIRVFDSRLLGSAGEQVTLGVGLGTSEVVTLTANDLDNGIISFGATANAHEAGEIVRSVGTGRLVREKTDVTDTAAHPDEARRLWQGDEERGGALLQSKESLTARDDLNVRALKDKLDLYDAVLREMKFGSFSPGVVSADPPSSFVARPKYYDFSGSITGSRFATVSIGNGTDSFGDYNGTDEQPFLDAVAYLASKGGGSIFVKEGTYAIGSTVTINTPIQILGEGKSVVDIQNDVAAGPALALDLAAADEDNKVVLQGVKISVGTGQNAALTTQDCTLATRDCEFECLIQLVGGGSTNSRIVAQGCLFEPPSGENAIEAAAGTEVLLNSAFNECIFTGSGISVFVQGALNNVQFNGCNFSGTGIITATAASSDVALRDCQSLLTSFAVAFSSLVSRFFAEGCSIVTTASTNAAPVFLFTGNCDTVSIRGCLIQGTFSGTGVGTQGSLIVFSGDSGTVSVENNFMFTNAGQVVDGVSWFSGSSQAHTAISVSRNVLSGLHRAVYLSNAGGLTQGLSVQANYISGGSQTFEQHGVLISGVEVIGSINGNSFRGLAGASLKRGVSLVTATGGSSLAVQNNSFDLGIGGSAATNSAGVWLDFTTATTAAVTVSNNSFENIVGSANIYGVYVTGGSNASGRTVNISENSLTGLIGTGGAGTIAASVYITGLTNGTVTNNTFTSAIASSDADVAHIALVDCQRLTVEGNSLSGVASTGTASTFESVVYVGGVTFNTRVVNNVIEGSTTDRGIFLNITGTTRNVSIDQNVVDMGSNMLLGIFATGSSASLNNLSVSGNRVHRLIRASGTGVLLSLPNTATAIRVCENLVQETTFDSGHTGISVTGDVSFRAETVQITGNVVRGELGASGTRTTTNAGIRLTNSLYYQINSNIVAWCDASIEGPSVRVENCTHGTVVGNCVTPSNGATNEIDMVSGSADTNISANIFGSSSAGTGTIAAGTGATVNGDNKAS